jgi:hypothetical protein
MANDGYPPIKGRIDPESMLVEFAVGGTGYGYPHKAMRHFEVRNGRAIQIDPIAPTLRDFVGQWLSAPWTESAARSESVSLKDWHVKLHRDDGMGDFPDPAMRCSSSADLWQISTHLYEAPRNYFLIRWRLPYHFTMVGVSDGPYADCTTLDAQGDRHPALISDTPE